MLHYLIILFENHKVPPTLCFDYMCGLKRFLMANNRQNTNDVTKDLAATQLVVDKFHFRNHVDQWCKENCNPHSIPGLGNTSSMEERFAWISGFKHISRYMNEQRFNAVLLIITWLDHEKWESCHPRT